MDNAQLTAFIFGVIIVVALGVIAYAQHTRRAELLELAGFFKPLIDTYEKLADVKLAAYGPQLAPIHGLLETAGGFFDEDTDALVKAINSPGVIAALRAALKEAQALTDGLPPMEAIPPVESLVMRGATFGASPTYTPPAQEVTPDA